MRDDNPMAESLLTQAAPTFNLDATYGFTCWNYDGRYGCRSSISFRFLPDDPFDAEQEAMDRAGLLGWVIGHFDGQGHIACPGCRHSLWDATRLRRWFPRERRHA
jgi:hypothetical protein